MPQQVAQTTQVGDGIVAIDTQYMRPLLDASHLILADGRAAFVDTGTNFSVPLLLDALREQGREPGDVDYLFLTHVHLDHAGGGGTLMQALPNATCVLHPRGAPHMADPAKLIAGTNAGFGDRNVQVLHTEGHARHHYCLNDPQSRGVFTGDSFGISYRELDTKNGEFIYPTTTPPHFDPAEAHKAIDRIMELRPERLYLTHYSRVDDLERLADDMHDCIDGFVAIAERHREAKDRCDAIQADMFDFLANRLATHGYAGDRDAMWSVMQFDVKLNSQGLDTWLSWLERQQ
jgi:glyoxylase-like metal-dependent hydrolase (beta-lactamase superfamily II)